MANVLYPLRSLRRLRSSRDPKTPPREPQNPLFDGDWYLATYPDVAASGMSAWEHFALHGAREGRRPNPLFDPVWYENRYVTHHVTRETALDHYLRDGWRQGFDPSPEFSTINYLGAHPHLRTAGTNPLVHFVGINAERLRATHGYIDIASPSLVAGWAWNGSNPNQRIRIDVRVDSVLAGSTVASVYREDLRGAGVGDGFHAFELPLPAGRFMEGAACELVDPSLGVVLDRVFLTESAVVGASNPPGGVLQLRYDASAQLASGQGVVGAAPGEPVTITLSGEPLADLILTCWLEGTRDGDSAGLDGIGCAFSMGGSSFRSHLVVRDFTASTSEAGGTVRSFSVRVRGTSNIEHDYRCRLQVPAHVTLVEWESWHEPRTMSSRSGVNHGVDDREVRGDVVIYTTAGAISTNALPLRSELVARELASRGRDVMYVPFAQVDPSMKDIECGKGVIRQTSAVDFSGNLEAVFERSRPGVFICSSKCDATAVRAASAARLNGWRVVYEVRDDMEAMKTLGFARYYDSALEMAVCRSADLITTVSAPLRDKLIAWGIPRERVHVLPNGATKEELDLAERRVEVTRARRAVYFGHLFPGRFDYELMGNTAEQFSDYVFHLYGPGLDTTQGPLPRNVLCLGQVSQTEFLEQEADAEIGLLPFRSNQVTFCLSPLKIAQYYALGLKVVSADIHQLRGKPLVFADPNTSFSGNFRAAIDHEVTRHDADAVREYMNGHTWDRIVDSMVRLINHVR